MPAKYRGFAAPTRRLGEIVFPLHQSSNDSILIRPIRRLTRLAPATNDLDNPASFRARLVRPNSPPGPNPDSVARRQPLTAASPRRVVQAFAACESPDPPHHCA